MNSDGFVYRWAFTIGTMACALCVYSSLMSDWRNETLKAFYKLAWAAIWFLIARWGWNWKPGE